MLDKINLDKTANAIKLLELVKVELVSCLPPHELKPYFRELDGIKGSLRNRIRLEDPTYVAPDTNLIQSFLLKKSEETADGTQEVGQQAAGDSAPEGTARGGDSPADN